MQSDEDNAQVILSVDAGGTFLKSALFRAGRLFAPLPPVPACSGCGRGEIEDAFRTVYRNALSQSPAGITGVAFSVPGPFDYRKGIFLMDHKFQAVKGCRLADFFPPLPMTFLHDADAFLSGVSGEKPGRLGGVTLGTGLGAAVMIDGKFLDNGQGSPLYPLWNRPFRGGIAEDFVSASALLKSCPGAKSVKELAERPGTDAVWRGFGDALAELLTAWRRELNLEKIYVGGGIAKAKERFMTPALAELPLEFPSLEDPGLHGAAKFFGRNQRHL
ncbi:MAG: ROK family protein [Lentisphaeria bacterium]|nr:ROK family protein [Lentisphaeria bacterium]